MTPSVRVLTYLAKEEIKSLDDLSNFNTSDLNDVLADLRPIKRRADLRHALSTYIGKRIGQNERSSFLGEPRQREDSGGVPKYNAEENNSGGDTDGGSRGGGSGGSGGSGAGNGGVSDGVSSSGGGGESNSY